MRILIQNGKVLTPPGWLSPASVVVCDGLIEEITTGNIECFDGECVDASNCFVVPGFIDLHIHGGGGRDFMEGTAEAFDTVIRTHLKKGTTGILATLASSSLSMIEQAAEETTRRMQSADTPIIGLHLEGPYLNPSMAGGQMPQYIRKPNSEEYQTLVNHYPCIRRWDAAPEMEGAMDFGAFIFQHGLVAGIAHTTADYPVMKEAWNHGFTHATHLYNGMKGFHKEGEYKHEGTVESVYLLRDMTVELIADGRHVPPAILRLVYQIKGVENTSLVTDALAPAGCDSAVAFDERVIIEDGVAKLRDHSALAGSIATMDQLIRVMVNEAEIPLEDAVRMASESPAKRMGIYHRKGSLQRGKDADIVLLDKDLNVHSVWQRGQFV